MTTTTHNRMSVHFSSAKDEWATPQDFFDTLNAEFEFDIDPCATAENAKLERYFTPEVNGLLQDWSACRCFVNPPYSQLHAWVKKCFDAAKGGALVVLLIPARTDTVAFHRYILPFSGVNSASHDLAWLAGIIDGEGCIGLYSGGNGDGKNLYLRLTVVNTDKPMLDRARAITMVGAVRTAHEATGTRRKNWIWECNSSDAASALSSVYPFLVTKQRQAQSALEFFHGPRMPWEAQVSKAAELSADKRLQSKPGVRVEIRFIKGRLKFGGAKSGAPFPSAVVVFRPQTELPVEK